MEELEDGLQFCRIRRADLRQQAKGLHEVHLRDCLLCVTRALGAPVPLGRGSGESYNNRNLRNPKGKLGMKIVNGDNNEIIITPEDFKRFWKKVNKFISSSMSGVHYRHYKAAIQDPQSTNVLALQLTIIARSGIPPESWSVGLQVMLEKIAGICLVEKLRTIMDHTTV